MSGKVQSEVGVLGTDPGRGWLWEKQLQCLKRCVASVCCAWLVQVGWGLGVSRYTEARSPRGTGASGSQVVLQGGGPCSGSAVPNLPDLLPSSPGGQKGLMSRPGFQFRPPAEDGKLEFKWALGSQCLQGFQNWSSSKS